MLTYLFLKCRMIVIDSLDFVLIYRGVNMLDMLRGYCGYLGNYLSDQYC